MMDEQLRGLLEQIDPLPVDESPDAIRYRTLLETIMNTPLDTEPTATHAPSESGRPKRRLHRSPVFISGVAAAALTAIVISAAALKNDNDTVSRQSLAIANAGPTMASCLPFDVSVLAAMPVAFAGTATEITPTSVTVSVDRWYTAATAETDLVDIALPAGTTSAALDGVDFVLGERYLLTATDGNINGCGFSGPATPDLESAFSTAFGG